MASGSVTNQKEFIFQNKETPPVQSMGKCKAVQILIVNQRTEIIHRLQQEELQYNKITHTCNSSEQLSEVESRTTGQLR